MAGHHRLVPIRRRVGHDYLLPDGTRWQYEIVLPEDVSVGDELRLEIRRFLIDEANQGIRGRDRLPADQANEVWSGPAFRVDSLASRVHVSLQLLDLRDYTASNAVVLKEFSGKS